MTKWSLFNWVSWLEIMRINNLYWIKLFDYHELKLKLIETSDWINFINNQKGVLKRQYWENMESLKLLSVFYKKSYDLA